MHSDLVRILVASDAIIGYKPLPDEPDYAVFLSENAIKGSHTVVPPEKDISPQEMAKKYAELYGGKKITLFIPGRRFDRFGTRHGRGGGWYDRFLAAIPAEWVRIGVADKTHVSDTPLVREVWDQTMDYLLIFNDGAWDILSFERDGRGRMVSNS